MVMAHGKRFGGRLCGSGASRAAAIWSRLGVIAVMLGAAANPARRIIIMVPLAVRSPNSEWITLQ